MNNSAEIKAKHYKYLNELTRALWLLPDEPGRRKKIKAILRAKLLPRLQSEELLLTSLREMVDAIERPDRMSGVLLDRASAAIANAERLRREGERNAEEI